MILLNRIFHSSRRVWLLAILTLLGLAAQCNSAGPPLPTTPTSPTLRVALLTPTTGELATLGRVMRNSIILAFDQWNNQGGVLNHRLEWVLYDTDCTFEAAQQATQQAVADGLQFIIGPICSEAAIAAAAVAEATNVLMISPAATHPLVTVNNQGQTRPTIFRVSYTATLQGQAAARFAHKTLNVDQAALLFDPNDDYATGLADAFANQFSTDGGKIVYQATYSSGADDFTEILMAISQAGAELIYLPTSHSVANQITRRLNELGLLNSGPESMILLGSDGWASDELNLAAVEGSYFPVHFAPANGRPFVQSWIKTYKSTYAVEPGTLAALGYDAANILLAAIHQAGVFEPTLVAKTLEQDTFQGVTGQVTFDHRHNPIKPVHFVWVQDGHITYISSVSVK